MLCANRCSAAYGLGASTGWSTRLGSDPSAPSTLPLSGGHNRGGARARPWQPLRADPRYGRNRQPTFDNLEMNRTDREPSFLHHDQVLAYARKSKPLLSIPKRIRWPPRQSRHVPSSRLAAPARSCAADSIA